MNSALTSRICANKIEDKEIAVKKWKAYKNIFLWWKVYKQVLHTESSKCKP